MQAEMDRNNENVLAIEKCIEQCSHRPQKMEDLMILSFLHNVFLLQWYSIIMAEAASDNEWISPTDN